MGERLRSFFYRRWFELREMLNGVARAWLLRFDNDYMRHDAERALVRDRERLRAEGIGPSDPRYPDLWDYIDPITLRRRRDTNVSRP